jgi:Sulfotransferase domain
MCAARRRRRPIGRPTGTRLVVLPARPDSRAALPLPPPLPTAPNGRVSLGCAQGRQLRTDTAARAFRATVESIVGQAAGHKTIVGANDSSMLGNLRIYDRLFEHPRMIAIFRNPIDQGLSAWHHNQRLADEEHDPSHRALMEKYGDLPGWLRHRAEEFKTELDDWRDFTAGRDHVYTIRFEDLVTNRLQRLREVFAFLGASVEDRLIEPIVAATAFETMRARARYPGFFRRAGLDLGARK